MTLFNAFLILLNTLILVSGQFLWKIGMTNRSVSFDSIGAIFRVMISPYILSGLFLYGMATVLWLFILTKVPLSVAYPIQSIAYILAVFGAYFFFQEEITLWKIIGVFLIMAGVSFIGISEFQK
ncbi:MAG: EamA family transporter [Firmicutes bacterium]|nr:EamA family transporter [Bacillota bacterium]